MNMKMNFTPETFNFDALRSLTSKELHTASVYAKCDVMKADHNLTNQMWIPSDPDSARVRHEMIQHVGHEKFGWAKPLGFFRD